MSKHETFNLVEIGKRLRTLRAYLRKTQSNMARELGISLSHYSKLEIGIGGMSHGLALALCRQFDLPEEWLLYGEGPQPDLSTIKITPRPQKVHHVQSQQPNPLTEDNLAEVISLVLQENFQSLAAQVAETMSIPLPRAMAMLVKEKLRKPQDEPGS